MKWFLAGLSLGIIITGIFFITAQVQKNTPEALAQGSVPPVTNLQVRNGPNLGEGIISWDAVPQATHYRIGYVNMEVDYHLASASCTGEWIDAFVYVDADARNIPVRNGRAEYTVRRLAPGARHAFTVLTSNNFTDSGHGGSVRSEFFWPSNPRWKFLAGRSDLPPGVSLPTGECTAVASSTPAPTRMTTPTAQPTPGPTRAPALTGDYDSDNDGLIEVSNLAQLHAIRWDLDGNGSPVPRYADAFPDAMPGMGCPSGCMGYELVADLDFDTNGNGEADAGDAYWNEGEGWVPIGDESRNFNTVFDGNGHKISNLYNKERYLGLFGTTGVASKIRRVGLVSVSMSSRCIGCGPQGSLVATNHGSISDSYVTGSVSGLESVGGLVGLNLGTITSSYSTSEVNGYTWPDVGGLVGENRGTISASYATGNVSSSGDRVGSLVGTNSGTIIASYATGNVSTRYEEIGGLVGRNLRTIIASYAVGNVSGSETTGYIGGLVGLNNGSITHSYWNTQTAGLNYSDGGVGKNTDELRSPTGYTGIYADWDVDVDQDGINDDPWNFGTSRQYPVLKYGDLSVAEQR